MNPDPNNIIEQALSLDIEKVERPDYYAETRVSSYEMLCRPPLNLTKTASSLDKEFEKLIERHKRLIHSRHYDIKIEYVWIIVPIILMIIAGFSAFDSNHYFGWSEYFERIKSLVPYYLAFGTLFLSAAIYNNSLAKGHGKHYSLLRALIILIPLLYIFISIGTDLSAYYQGL